VSADPIWRDLITNIRELMEARGWNQRRLSEASGLTPAAISNYFNYNTAPQLDAVYRLAAALDVSPSRLLARDREVGTVIRYEKVEPTREEMIKRFSQELEAAAKWQRLPAEIQESLSTVLVFAGEQPERWDRVAKLLAKVADDLVGEEVLGKPTTTKKRRK
jgi:transcriptional regulator with XRE-family HTH domain